MPGIIGIATRTYMPSWTLGYYSHLIKPDGTRLVMCEGSAIHGQRNRICRQRTPQDEWVFFMDDDMVLEPDTLVRLLAHNVPIVGGLYLTRHPPYISAAGWKNPDGTARLLSADDMHSGRLVEVDWVGTGCLLIRREVFEALEYPWFEAGRIHPDEMSEDVWFCLKAKAKGFPVFVDTSVRPGHRIDAYVRWGDRGVELRVQ